MDKKRSYGIALSLLILSQISNTARASLTPEQQAASAAKLWKPITSQEWSEIIGKQSVDQYAITKGDTLYDVSKKFFGDPKYWPKIWALNNPRITNPHWIKPGNTIAFYSGSGSNAPSLALEEHSVTATSSESLSAISHPSPSQRTRTRSQEWKLLPQQRWEDNNLKVSDKVDAQGFDIRSEVGFKESHRHELAAVVASNEVEPLGIIAAAPRDSDSMTDSDIVVIDAEKELNPGMVYSVTALPNKLKASNSDNTARAYSYPNLGRVKILEKRDDYYLGQIISMKYPIARGAHIIPNIPTYSQFEPIAGPSALEGILLIDRNLTAYTTSQFRQAFVSRGSQDGIKTGMIFRGFIKQDPVKRKTFTESDILPYADMQVIQVSDNFCSVMILNSVQMVEDKSRVVLLTDLSKLDSKIYGGKSGIRTQDLDSLPVDSSQKDNLLPGSEESKDLELPPADLENTPAPEKTSEPAPAPLPTSKPEQKAEKSEPVPAPTQAPADTDLLNDDGVKLNDQEKKELKQLEEFDSTQEPPLVEDPT